MDERTAHQTPDENWGWGVRSSTGVFPCRNRSHAAGLMVSTSIVVGPIESREMVRRRRAPWEVVS